MIQNVTRSSIVARRRSCRCTGPDWWKDCTICVIHWILFLNMMIPVAPIYLVPLILDHHNMSKKKTVINLLQQKDFNWFLTVFEGCSLKQIQIQLPILFHHQTFYSKEKRKIHWYKMKHCLLKIVWVKLS